MTKPWYKQLRNFRLVDDLAATEHVLTYRTSDGVKGRMQDVGPTRWTTQDYVDDTDRVRFLPHIAIEPPDYLLDLLDHSCYRWPTSVIDERGYWHGVVSWWQT
jgi:hypothetical protein